MTCRVDGGRRATARSTAPVDAVAAVGAPSETVTTEEVVVAPSEERRMPRWVVPAVVVFWSGFLGALAVRFFWGKLSGLFILRRHLGVPVARHRARRQPAGPPGLAARARRRR